MMGTVTVAAIGICAGLLVALFGNVVVLPFVLRHQAERLGSHGRVPLFGWDSERLAMMTRFAYRLVLPLVFAIVGAVAAVSVFGEVE
jgi:hypothetical protein